jgi:hypothetical protein
MNPRVLNVVAEPGYTLRLTFTNGEAKVFDVTPLLDKGVFRELKDPSLFQSVRPWHGTVQWSGGQDLCPDTLYEESVSAKYHGPSRPRKASASSIHGKKRVSGRHAKASP